MRRFKQAKADLKVILDKEPNNKQALDLYMKTTGQMEKIRLEAYEKMT